MGLEGNVDVSIYAIPEYTRRQMYEIREGLEQGLDVSKYAKPEIHAFDMENIRYKMYLKKERENKKMNEDLVLPVVEEGKIKYLKPAKERKQEMNEDLVLPVLEDGEIKYLKHK